MTWWGWAIITVLVALWLTREWRLYKRGFRCDILSYNYRSSVAEGQKKAPAQAEAGTGIEYGGTHLP